MQIGLSPELRTPERMASVAQCMNRVLSGDPGDENDPEIIMENISAWMEDAPHCALFECEDTSIVLFMRIKQEQALAITVDESLTPPFQEAIQDFGFNPATLQPLEE